MGRLIVVEGDATNSGGRVITGSAFTDIDGRAVARVGDKASCPAHKGIFPIISGDISLIIDGQPAARDKDRLACGCSLIAGAQQMVHIDAGGAPRLSSPTQGLALGLAQASPLAASLSGKAAVCEECLIAAAKNGAVFLGR
ncbi:PAAR domain-containing protein [Stenotrophomonas sp. LGBM10]|uniref:PAAR domain-containing protein n=1 Tax=Stenotrophomonas sp. LGBM10 TaxID=3390038 RepID=UPI00398AB554